MVSSAAFDERKTVKSKLVSLAVIFFSFSLYYQPTVANEVQDNRQSRESIDTRPNIIVILADDLGYNDVGYTGATDIQTPNIDTLAAEGVRFTNGYVTRPYCGPSRAGLLAGVHQARFGMENNVSYFPQDKNMGLPLSVETFPERLKKRSTYGLFVQKIINI